MPRRRSDIAHLGLFVLIGVGVGCKSPVDKYWQVREDCGLAKDEARSIITKYGWTFQAQSDCVDAVGDVFGVKWSSFPQGRPSGGTKAQTGSILWAGLFNLLAADLGPVASFRHRLPKQHPYQASLREFASAYGQSAPLGAFWLFRSESAEAIEYREFPGTAARAIRPGPIVVSSLDGTSHGSEPHSPELVSAILAHEISHYDPALPRHEDCSDMVGVASSCDPDGLGSVNVGLELYLTLLGERTSDELVCFEIMKEVWSQFCYSIVDESSIPICMVATSVLEGEETCVSGLR